jgi:diaminopimelate decarboxylase
MSGFSRHDEHLFVENLPLVEVAKRFGTPCYVYSKQVLLDNLAQLKAAFPKSTPRFFYAVKANSNLAIIRVLCDAGCGFDIVSAGELARVLAAGGDASKTVFSGVGKSADDIKAALQAGIGCFNVESAQEMTRIESIAEADQKMAPIAVRVTPDVDGDTHRFLTTGVKESKFGVPPATALAMAQQAASSAHINFLGFACHLGSQICREAVYISAAQAMVELVKQARIAGITVQHMDMGGGFAVDYDNGSTLDISLAAYDATLADFFSDTPVWMEPGRSITATAGVLLTTVEYMKPAGDKYFWLVDAGMNDFLRPMLYDAMHRIEMVKNTTTPPLTGDVAGPICESADILGRNCTLTAVTGDVLAVRDVGAYGAAMMSNYNSHPRPCEVLVSGDKVELVRKRELINDLFRDECIAFVD